jgi:hypothetical protein
MVIIGLHPELNAQQTLDAWGFIPSFLDEDDERPAKEQFNDRYAFGGGWRPVEGVKLEGNVMRFPGDPPFKALSLIQFNDEVIMLFVASMVAIVQQDGSYEVARMD